MKTINFEDDTLLYHSFNNPIRVHKTLNHEFKNIIDWMQVNHLKLNLTKTNYLLFLPKSNKYKSLDKTKLFKLNNYQIEQKYRCKYLGLIIDSNMNWKPHIEYVKTKLAKSLGIMYRIRYYLNKKTLNLILHSLIITHLKYGILCYGRANKILLKPLSILFNNALRCINLKKRIDKVSIKTLFTNQGVLTIDQMLKLEIGKFCFKYTNHLLPQSFSTIFTKITQIHSYTTRNCNQRLFLNQQHKKSGFTTLSYLGTKFWNKIPNKIKETKSIFGFT